MLTCRQASHLASQNLDRKLTLRERSGLRLHIFMCAACRRFEHQIKLLQRAMHLAEKQVLDDESGTTLSAEARERIRERIRE